MFHKRNHWLRQQTNRLMTGARVIISANDTPCLICLSPLRNQQPNAAQQPNHHINQQSDEHTHHTAQHINRPIPQRLNSSATQQSNSHTSQQLNKLCLDCQASIPWMTQISCTACGRYERCHDCQRRQQTYFVYNRSAVRYDHTMKTWLSQFKYRKNERLTPLFVAMLLPTFHQLQHTLSRHGASLHAITYIPLDNQRMAERGFNQAELIARGLAEDSGLPLIPLLIKSRHTHKQSYKSRAARLRDLEGVFQGDEAAFARLRRYFAAHKVVGSPHILLVDDVFTTGSTLNEAAKIIAQHLDCHVYGMTWAR